MPADPFVHRTTPLTWTNYHRNVAVPLAARWRVTNEMQPTVTQTLRRTAERIRDLLATAVASGARVRACGSRWSFSDIPVVRDGWTIETDQLNLHRPIRIENVDPAYNGACEELILVQCGKSIAEINQVLEAPALGRALRTSGASNGQTIGGMIGTGVHGSAIDVGAIESQVAGLQLVTSSRIIWLEHPSNPVLDPAYVALLGAELVRDAQQFEAALVSLGSLGVVHAVLLRTTGRYRLKSAQIHLPYNQLQFALNTLDFTGLALPDPARRPYFFQVIVDPAQMTTGYVMVRYKQLCPPDLVPNYNLKTGLEPGTDVPVLVSKMITALPRLRNLTVRTLMSVELAEKLDAPETVPGETYSFTSARTGVASTGFAIPLAQVTNALEIARQAFATIPSATVVFTCRFAQRSPGTLSFVRYDPTCVFDLDGVDTKATQRLIRLVADRFDAAGMPYTQHWGKLNSLTAARVRNGYGSAVDRWNAARRLLLPTQAERDAFASPFIDSVGLNA
jgi:hypothetical protein